MKFDTGWKIVKITPYALSILVGTATFAATYLYGKFCTHLGADTGMDSVIEVMGRIDPQMKEDFLECTAIEGIRFHR